MGAFDTQIGGGHYKDMKIQPIEFIKANNLDFCQGSIIKYICRFRNKNGKEDLEKIIHYAKILIESEYPEEKKEKEDVLLFNTKVLFYPEDTDYCSKLIIEQVGKIGIVQGFDSYSFNARTGRMTTYYKVKFDDGLVILASSDSLRAVWAPLTEGL